MHQHMLGPSTSLGGTNNSALQSSVLSEGVLLSHSQPTREEIKKNFETREGVYRSVPSAEFSRPRPLPQYHMPPGIASAAASQIAAAGSTVRVSFLNGAEKSVESPEAVAPTSSTYEHHKNEPNGARIDMVDEAQADKICFNVGKELYVFSYRGTQTETDLSRPIDKRVYKGTSPTYHAFNQESAKNGSCQLLIGFTLGQLQIIDPLEKSSSSPFSRLYNEDRYIEKTSVTCIRWLPGDSNIFLASYVSGNLYVYDQRISAASSNNNGSSQPPPWTIHKEGDKFAIHTWKGKVQRNPVTRWQIGEGSIHQFSFSGSDGKMMATVSHDGFLRIFNYHAQELLAVMKSYFGGLLTLSWSPDAKLIATGGEDDLLTVYSVAEKRVVCRGQAHKSWVSQVKFDPYLCTTEEDLENNGIAMTSTFDDVAKDFSIRSGPVPSTSADLNSGVMNATSTFSRCSLASFNTINGAPAGNSVRYRIGSVGHDTFLCLWDITEDMLNQGNIRRHRNSTIIAPMTTLEVQTNSLVGRLEDLQEVSPGGAGVNASSDSQSITNNHTTPRPEKQKKKKFTKRLGFSKFTSGSSSATSNPVGGHKIGTLMNGASVNSESSKKQNPGLISQISCCNETRMLGSKFCPGIRDVPMIEPLMCKKVSHDRLTVLEFREDCVVTACQEGYICTWGRPGRYQPKRDCINSPGTASPESGQKPSGSTSAMTSSYGYGSDALNGVPPSRSSSTYSNTASTSVYHRPTYAWQNAN
uniref:Isoform a of WD repeat-containing protein 20 homolog n=1 Tax=Caenorhabditis elegans TaxID=6239 RepID=D9N129-2